jgi:predicted NBD/HSP70 family sugar kinase
VANDSRAAAFATFLFEGEERPANLIAIKVGHGIGAGLVLDGQLFGGDGFGAGEIGHIVIEPDGASCHCGRFGCLETVASVPAILRRAFFQAKEEHARIPQSIEAIATAAAEGDELALGVVRSAGRALGAAIASLTGALDVRRIVVLGSATVLGEPWLEAMRDEARRRTLATLARETEIVNGGPAEDAVLLGTCALLLTRELGLTVRR